MMLETGKTDGHRSTVGVTQDNTPPGSIFKARLLHIGKSVGPEQGVVGKRIILGAENPTFENRSKGCVILRHLR